MATRSTGRPRDPRIEQAALVAVRELLAEGGYAAVTGAAVASRAGTTKAALYRRWPALPHLVHEAVFPDELALGADVDRDTDLGDVAAHLVRGTRDALCTPAAAAALPGLLAEAGTYPDLHATMIGRFAGVLAALDERLRHAVADGEAHPDVRAADLVQGVVGTVIAGLLLTPGALATSLDDAWADRLTAHVLRSLRP
ncbi:helix-turn-helix domain-containing protein [Nocardioides sp. R1-1]|uniref:TetR/AcrR family transcriptional regulator n=1 Tax=Nocardioides sp. R1-1 TaxID=3383502 RepID=UPI0038CF4104